MEHFENTKPQFGYQTYPTFQTKPPQGGGGVIKGFFELLNY